MELKKSNYLLKELLEKQLPNIDNSKKMSYVDIKRMSKYLLTSIFDNDNCCLWTGYITNENNSKKGTYINFYFNKEKTALHRLLYLNFIGDISNNEYIKFSCSNKGKCCNINHMKKYSYNYENVPVNTIKHNIYNRVHIVKNNLIVEF